MDEQKVTMEKLVTLAKTRGFIFPGSEIYGGLSNSWDYGPLGVELKNNIKQVWWKMFVQERLDMVGIDAALIMNPKVWEASGHVATFSDPLVECRDCHHRFRLDKLIEDASGLSLNEAYLSYVVAWLTDLKERMQKDLLFTKISAEEAKIQKANLEKEIAAKKIEMLKMGIEPDTVQYQSDTKSKINISFSGHDSLSAEHDEVKKLLNGGIPAYLLLLIKEQRISCSNCEKNNFTAAVNFNLMLKTFLGPSESNESVAYLRPETAQAMFVDFPNVVTASRKRVPFGMAQIGKAFRNEITPGNFIFRTREFEQMEIEYFIHPSTWEQTFEAWLENMYAFMDRVGIDRARSHNLEVAKDELAHYSKRTVDIEFDYPFGRKELYGLAYRTDFDLSTHAKFSGESMIYTDPMTNEKYIPHVIEPSFGVDRTLLAVMLSAYDEETVTSADGEGDTRVVLRFKKELAPIKIAILPLSKKEELSVVARPLAEKLAKHWRVDYDETQSIGKRYRRQDEVGTPFCVTVDFDTLNDQAVTVRDRDTMEQVRIPLTELEAYFANVFNG